VENAGPNYLKERSSAQLAEKKSARIDLNQMKVRCTQCGAEIPIEEDAGFIQCEYCGTHLFVEVDRTVQHYNFRPRMEAGSLASTIMRELSRLELTLPVEITRAELVYFPFWQITTEQGRNVTIPGAITTIENLAGVTIPAGDLKFFDPENIPSGKIIPPETLLDGALAQFKGLNLRDEVKESALIHLPVFLVSYRYQDNSYEAAVDALSGNVYADEYPPLPIRDKDRFFGLMMLVTMLIFVLEGVLIRGFGFTILAYALTGVPLYFGIRALLKSKGW
jgi:DNA-directed RNA polymerase subunit RPC12/RpoP